MRVLPKAGLFSFLSPLIISSNLIKRKRRPKAFRFQKQDSLQRGFLFYLKYIVVEIPFSPRLEEYTILLLCSKPLAFFNAITTTAVQIYSTFVWRREQLFLSLCSMRNACL